jgi:hypothetical protein
LARNNRLARRWWGDGNDDDDDSHFGSKIVWFSKGWI